MCSTRSAQNYHGHLNGTIEAVFDANQVLADEQQPFRAGVVIALPDLAVPSEAREQAPIKPGPFEVSAGFEAIQ